MGLLVSRSLVQMTLQLAVTTASFRLNVDIDLCAGEAFDRNRPRLRLVANLIKKHKHVWAMIRNCLA